MHDKLRYYIMRWMSCGQATDRPTFSMTIQFQDWEHPLPSGFQTWHFWTFQGNVYPATLWSSQQCHVAFANIMFMNAVIHVCALARKYHLEVTITKSKSACSVCIAATAPGTTFQNTNTGYETWPASKRNISDIDATFKLRKWSVWKKSNTFETLCAE